jgi:hypothetical protein
MEKIRQDTSPNALRGIEICESRVSRVTSFFGLPGESFGDFCVRLEIAAGEVAGGIETA